MIETLKQSQEAIKEIKELTGWTNSRLATKIGVFRGSLNKIESGATSNTPQDSTMAKLDAELERVKRVHG